VRVLVVEDEPYMTEAIRDGLRLAAIAAGIAGDGDTALELLIIDAYDIAVLDRDIPGPSGGEIAERIVACGSGMPILMLTAADRLDRASGFGLGADDYLTKPFELRSSCSGSGRSTAGARAGLGLRRLDPGAGGFGFPGWSLPSSCPCRAGPMPSAQPGRPALHAPWPGAPRRLPPCRTRLSPPSSRELRAVVSCREGDRYPWPVT
jgi:CheY-like chemotaxis protein